MNRLESELQVNLEKYPLRLGIGISEYTLIDTAQKLIKSLRLGDANDKVVGYMIQRAIEDYVYAILEDPDDFFGPEDLEDAVEKYKKRSKAQQAIDCKSLEKAS